MNGKILLKHIAKWRLLYVVTLLASLSIAGVNAFSSYAPTVISDKDDYKPGEVAIITGSGWKLDTKVKILIEEEPEYDHHNNYEVDVNDDGTWVLYFPIDERHLGVKFHLTATGDVTGYVAETRFTDGNFTFGAIGLPASTEVTINYTIAGGGQGNGTFDGTFTPPATANGGGNNKTVTVNNFAPNSFMLSGVKYSILNYTINSTTGTTNSFQSGGGSTSTAFRANYGALTVNSATGVYGGAVNLSARLYSNYQTTTGISNKQIVFSINGTSVGSATTNSTGVATLAGVNLQGFNVGTHTITASFNGDNSHFAIDVTGTLEITKGSATLALGNLTHTFDGTAKSATVTTTPAGLTGVAITYNGSTTAPTTAGTYEIVAILNNVNYEAEPVTGSLVIAKATANVELADLEHTYNGNAKSASATTNALGSSSFTFTYDGSTESPVNHKAGGYAVIATLVNANYSGSATGTLLINKADQSISWANPASIEYGTLLSSAQLNASLTFGDGALTYTPKSGTLLNAGTHELQVMAAETNNYKAATTSVSIDVTKATPIVSLIVGGPYTYNGSAQFVNSATVTGVAGAALGNATVTYTKEGNPVESPVNAGSYAVTASFAGNNNYEPADATGTLVIDKATATLTVSELSHTYDGTAKAINVTTNPANLNGLSVSYKSGLDDVPAANVVNAGSYLYLTSLNNENYSLEPRSGTLTIAKAAMVIKAGNATRTYGDENPVFTGSVVSGAVQGETFNVTASSAAISSSDVGEYDIIPVVTGATLGNYNVTANNGTLTVTKRPITITAGAGQNKVYGESDPAAYTYQISGSLVDNSHLSGTLTRVAGEDVGDYAITQGTLVATPNYALTYTGADFVISKRDVTVTADAKSKTYGDDDPEFTYAITSGSLVNGDAFSGVLSREDGENVGDYAINLGTLSLGNNYSLGFAGSAVLGITPKAVTVTPIAGQSKVYGSADPVLVYNNTELVGNDTFTGALSKESGSNVGAYNITQGTLALSSNYSLNFVDGVKFNITPKSLTASISATDKVYDGTTAASATGSVPAAELVASDVVEVTVSSANFDTKNVGTGKVVTANVSISDPNYSLSNSVASTTASIRAKEITGAFAAANKVYDGSNAASVTDRSLEGVISPDDVQLTGGAATFADKNAAIGKSVTLAGADLIGQDKDNYLLTNVSSVSADITPKPASVTPLASSKVYGTLDPALTGSTSGFVAADGITASFMRTIGETVGDYTISASLQPQGELSNYNITYNSAVFEITKASLTVIAANSSRVYGDENPVFTGTVTGIVAGDIINASYATPATKASAVGAYPIEPTLTGDALSNYTVSPTNGTLTITKASLTATAYDKSRIYGIANPELDGELSGVKNEDDITASYTTAATAASNVGEYAITTSLLDPDSKLGNYEVTTTNGKLTITQAPASIALAGLEKVYNGAGQGVEVTTSPADLAVNVTFAGGDALPKSAGSYAVVAALNNGNYTADNATGTLVIAPKEVTATLANSGKVYDGTTAAPGTTASLSGVIGEDNVTAAVAGAAFNSANAGPRTVSATVVLEGDDKGNYTLGNVTNATATITPKVVTAGIVATNKVYDGTTAASATGSVPAADIVAGDEVAVTVSNANFNTKDVGTGKAVTANVSISNPNYSLSLGSAATTADITQAPLTIAAPSMSKYCGQVDPMSGYSCEVSGAVNGEQFVTSYTIDGTAVKPVCTEFAKLSNYDVTYINGILTINGLTLDASNASNPRSIHEDVVIAVTIKDGETNVSGVSVKLLFDGIVKGTATSDANGIAKFILGKLSVNVYAVTAEAGNGCSVSPVTYLPIYDPEGGFVTGGGWINSPAGALEGSEVSGKANFGFVAKYKKGRNEVEGNTEFQFQAGSINFKSLAHNAGSLVISGAKATYKGTGTIAGHAGTYEFMVVATDGQVNGGGGYDKFRIKIWNGGNVVYDNARGTLETDVLGDNTILGGGSIVIHENKALNASTGKKLEMAGELEGLSTARFDNYPNAFADRTTIRFAVDTEQHYALEVYDIRGALVKKVSAGVAEAGKVYEFELDGRNLAEGVYFAKLATGSKMQTIKMLLKK